MNARNYKELKRDFTSMPMEFRPVPFYHMDGRFAENGKLTEDVAKNIALYKKSGYGGIVRSLSPRRAGTRAPSRSSARPNITRTTGHCSPRRRSSE